MNLQNSVFALFSIHKRWYDSSNWRMCFGDCLWWSCCLRWSCW